VGPERNRWDKVSKWELEYRGAKPALIAKIGNEGYQTKVLQTVKIATGKKLPVSHELDPSSGWSRHSVLAGTRKRYAWGKEG